jgi:hypothetical protein
MKEYKCFEILEYVDDTEELLNEYAEKGWRLVCAYSKNNYYLIMERDANLCKRCGK